MKLPAHLYEMQAEAKFHTMIEYIICDDNDEAVCQCWNEEDAKQILALLNQGLKTLQKAS